MPVWKKIPPRSKEIVFKATGAGFFAFKEIIKHQIYTPAVFICPYCAELTSADLRFSIYAL
jgi:hypothetical protein